MHRYSNSLRLLVAAEYLCANRAPSKARRIVDVCDDSCPVMYASFWCVRRMSGDGANGYSVDAVVAGSGCVAVAMFAWDGWSGRVSD